MSLQQRSVEQVVNAPAPLAVNATSERVRKRTDEQIVNSAQWGVLHGIKQVVAVSVPQGHDQRTHPRPQSNLWNRRSMKCSQDREGFPRRRQARFSSIIFQTSMSQRWQTR